MDCCLNNLDLARTRLRLVTALVGAEMRDSNLTTIVGHAAGAQAKTKILAGTLFVILVSGCGGGNSSDGTGCATGASDATIEMGDVRVDPESQRSFCAGTYRFGDLSVGGKLFFKTGPVVIEAKTITVDPEGEILAPASRGCPGALGHDGLDIEIYADTIDIGGLVAADGVSGTCVGDDPDLRRGFSGDGGNILIESDTISIAGTVSASGAHGFRYSTYQTESEATSGGRGGLVSISYDTIANLIGTINARGGGGSSADNNSGGYFTGGGDGGVVSVSPAGVFPSISVNVSGGIDGAGDDPSENGADGEIFGVL